MTSPSLNQRLRRAPSTTAQQLPGECLVLDLRSGAYYTLGEVGGFIWQRLDPDKRIADLVPEVVAEFEVDEQTAARDLLDFVAQTLDHRLTEPV